MWARSDSTIGGPREMLGTKWPSITSTWSPLTPGGHHPIDITSEMREIDGENGGRTHRFARGPELGSLAHRSPTTSSIASPPSSRCPGGGVWDTTFPSGR